VDREPAPDPGRDDRSGDPLQDDAAGWRLLPSRPDPLDDEEWERICAARGDEDEPGDEDEEWYADPNSGPPPELAGVPVAMIFAQAEADGAEEAALTAMAIEAGICRDGYAHRRGALHVTGPCDGPAAGFALGMPYDRMAPCAALAGVADKASGEDRAFADVNDDQLMGLIGARQRLSSRQAWELLMAVAEFIRRRPEPGCATGLPGRMPEAWNPHAVSELAAQLRMTAGGAESLLSLAHDLEAKLPATSAALRDGVIDLDKAHVIALRCGPLNSEEARAAEAILFADPNVDEMTRRTIWDRISRAVIQVNPEAAAKRRQQAARTRRIEVWAENSGNAALAGRELPPAAVLAASQKLTARARELRRAGAQGDMDELRVLAYLEALGVLNPLDGAQPSAGQHAAGSGPTGPDSPAGPGPGSRGGPAPDGAAGPGPGGAAGPGSGPGPGAAAGAAGPVPAAFVGRVNMTIPLPTLLGLAERPGMMSRIGPIDPALARDLAAAAAGHPSSTWCLTVTGPDGRPVAHGCGRPPGRRDRTHPDAAARDGPVYTPGGGRAPPGSGTVRLSPAALTGAAGGPGAGRDLVFVLEPLAGPCDHRHQAAGHDPGVMLRHLTGILNGTCTFPPCRRPESQSDYEHSLPYDQGGRTCLCEAGPVCRRNHRDKQSPGWHLEDAGARGWFRWTTPSGRSYLSRPTQYPD
jgi:hypothetical protein